MFDASTNKAFLWQRIPDFICDSYAKQLRFHELQHTKAGEIEMQMQSVCHSILSV